MPWRIVRFHAMRVRAIQMLPVVVGVGAILLAAWWMPSESQTRGMAIRVPGADEKGAVAVKRADLAGEVALGEGKALDLAGSWPGFRGRNFDNIGQETGLEASAWGKAGPRREW